MRFSKLKLACLSLVFLLAFTACGKTADTSESTIEDEVVVTQEQNESEIPVRDYTDSPEEHSTDAIKERGVLVVAIVDNNPPFTFFEEDGSRSGMDSAMANTIAQDLEVELEVMAGTKEEVIKAVETGVADIGLGAFVQGDTAISKVDATFPYAGGAQSLVICLEDQKRYTKLSSFDTKTIAVIKGNSDILKGLIPEAFAKEVKDGDAGIKAIRSGSSAAFLIDSFRANAYAQDNPDLAICKVALETQPQADANVVLTMKDNESLTEFINTSIIEKYTKTAGLGRLMISANEKAKNNGLSTN